MLARTLGDGGPTSTNNTMYESAKRFLQADDDQVKLLFYLGDFDPSGEDMVRDVKDRLEMFGVELEVEKLALTKAQIAQYNPPPNPAKMTDSRAAAYVEKHGSSSWEVDALPLCPLIGLLLLRRECLRQPCCRQLRCRFE